MWGIFSWHILQLPDPSLAKHLSLAVEQEIHIMEYTTGKFAAAVHWYHVNGDQNVNGFFSNTFLNMCC